MNDVNKLILRLASLQYALLANANAYDDDLPDTWENLIEEYEATKSALDKYIGG